MDIKWENPPERNNDRYEEIAAALKTRPGDWAVVTEYTDDPSRKSTPASRAASLASAWRNGTSMKTFAKDEFEVIARKGKVYARYVGADA